MMTARKHFLLGATAAIFLFAASDHSRASTWANLYGGSGSDQAVAGKPTADGGCILGGQTQSFNLGPEGSNHAWLVKLAESGQILWQKAYRNAEKEGYTVRDVNPTSAGGYVVAGTAMTYYEADGPMSQDYGWLVKLGADGAVLWQKGYKDTGGYGASFAAAQETADGGFIAVGEGLLHSAP